MVHDVTTLQVIEEEGLAENAAKLGVVLQRELSSLDPSLATIVRGKGLLYAVVIKPQGGRQKSITTSLCTSWMTCGTSTLLTCVRTITRLCSDQLLATLAKNQPLALLIVK